ncbi:osmosensor protein [Mucor ambiguus]|uniref:Osmosensor protein n=1 Tax=Mucor ambiguus TaxID=91626 RepID=A0A0C9N7H0_9FUNG|nr:osmosensor protein [Mucor ambiguus]
MHTCNGWLGGYICWSVYITHIYAFNILVLCLIAISIPYTTDEVLLYISAGRASLSAAASGYIIMMITQFSWIFLLGIQHEVSVLRSFSDLNHHHRVYTNSIHHYQKEQPSNNNIVFGNNTMLDQQNPSYPTPIPTQTSYPTTSSKNQLVSVPIYMNSPPSPQQNPSNTVFLSPHSEYLIPVTAIHNYRANKEDPNELSFTKGELLYVHEKKGSWWQAKKSDGTIGMIPSNYVN